MSYGHVVETIGPLDADTLRPVKTLTTVKLLAMLIVALFALGSAVLLAPQIGAALGFTPTVSATVTEIIPFDIDPAEGSTCTREQVVVAWGDGHTGSFATCSGGHSGADMAVEVGDVIEVRALAGWESVVLGPVWPNVLVTAVLVALLVAAIIPALRYRRELVALNAVGRGAVGAPALEVTRTALAMAFDPVSMGKGKRATAQVSFDSAPYRPLRLQVPGTSTEAMSWRGATAYPLRVARSGRPAGPYALRLASGGTIIAAGRAMKPTR